ncbi:PfkB family carbohydrate kinase [Mesorhizobium sp. M2A.F.Ca.ET.067.02.1.1]|uniref:carbohydrate kinase family protein n=1 Tax=Mesorhizobium sp. M2A.F.Ca.ET.067.02.1.1 TaxID=2496749 RepID=UPI000FD4C6BD|nr:PfkB family carbohydrate kinase [Mesorhizobium sp. M2A.F.Ca.ET.067.02.1.1]RUW79990.1 LacI family DNA-binding transcriptional regulator [Mesorhizobium sp. M2A.F.Ca.ET.067.02.1.1]TIU54310.1 MAG: LacI family DNA-binding transcriptional regulator [Mesorhizobium sp.]
MQRKRPTIADVARAAGVSIGTVSNFINGTAGLKEGTRERIEKAIAALMYRPSSFARSLPGRAPQRPKNLDHLPRLLVAGRVSVDFLCRVEVLPHRDDRITASHIDKALGRPAANLAVAAAGVGAPYALDVELATAVGNDAESDWALGELSKLGVHALPIRSTPNNRLSQAIVIIERNGSRTIISEPFELGEVDLTANLHIQPEKRPACLHIEGFHYETMTASIARFHQAGWKVSLHSAGLPRSARTPEIFAQMVGQIDLTFINDVMIREIYGFRTRMATMIEEVRLMLSRIKPRGTVVLTLGEFGAVVFPATGGPQIEVPALPVNRVDATGAGDSFAGIFLSLWLHGASLETAARYAAVGASLTTTVEGAQGYIADFATLKATAAASAVMAS